MQITASTIFSYPYPPSKDTKLSSQSQVSVATVPDISGQTSCFFGHCTYSGWKGFTKMLNEVVPTFSQLRQVFKPFIKSVSSLAFLMVCNYWTPDTRHVNMYVCINRHTQSFHYLQTVFSLSSKIDILLYWRSRNTPKVHPLRLYLMRFMFSLKKFH